MLLTTKQQKHELLILLCQHYLKATHYKMKIGYKSCKTRRRRFHTLFLIIILNIAFTDSLATPQARCTPYTDCIENHYVIYKSPLTVQSESRSNVEYYHLYNDSLSLKDQISYRLKWKTFQLGGNFPKCENDSLTVFTGCGSSSKRIGTFCGRTTPHDIYSLDGCFTLELMNGRTYQSKFEAEIESLPLSKTSGPFCTNSPSMSTESNGVILSPGWPTIPKSRSSCTWSIKANANQYIVLNFMDVVLGGSSTIEITIKSWSVTKNACIKNNNEKTYRNIQTLQECQDYCERESWCQSLDYNIVTKNCYLSKLTSSSSFYKNPCHVTPDDYVYAEKIKAINLWTVTKFICIKNNNERKYDNIQTFRDCQEMCEKESWCRSLNYNTRENQCHLSKSTSSSACYWDYFIHSEISRGVQIGPNPFSLAISKENVENITTYMTYNREVEIKYTPDDITGEGTSNRFALGWMLLQSYPQSTSKKEIESSPAGWIGGTIFVIISFSCFVKHKCHCNASRRSQSAVTIQTRRSSIGNQNIATTPGLGRTRRASTGSVGSIANPRMRSRTLSNRSISRRHSLVLEMPTPGTMATGGGIGFDNIAMELPTNNDPFDSPPLYNNVMALPSAPTYNDVTLGPSPPIEAPPPSYDEALNMVR
eukprot:TCONS_00005924-protein